MCRQIHGIETDFFECFPIFLFEYLSCHVMSCCVILYYLILSTQFLLHIIQICFGLAMVMTGINTQVSAKEQWRHFE